MERWYRKSGWLVVLGIFEWSLRRLGQRMSLRRGGLGRVLCGTSLGIVVVSSRMSWLKMTRNR